jgi:hypothetical protein
MKMTEPKLLQPDGAHGRAFLGRVKVPKGNIGLILLVAALSWSLGNYLLLDALFMCGVAMLAFAMYVVMYQCWLPVWKRTLVAIALPAAPLVAAHGVFGYTPADVAVVVYLIATHRPLMVF